LHSSGIQQFLFVAMLAQGKLGLCRHAHLFNPVRIAVGGGAQKVAAHLRVLDVQ